MVRIFASLALILFFSLSALAENIGGNRTGTQLVSFLRTNFQPTASLSYTAARQQMFGEIDNRGGKVRCVYTGVELTTSTIPNGKVMNTEHTWPQSLFHEHLPMRADLHHLFPTLNRPNGERANLPFGEIPDNTTTGWWHSATKQTQRPRPAEIDQFSESISTKFEPREDHKGNVARAMFYFWVIYGDKDVTPEFISPQLSTLAAWHVQDPADDAERTRTTKIKAFQGNANPFVLDPTLVARILIATPPAAPISAQASPSDIRVMPSQLNTTTVCQPCCCTHRARRAIRRCR